LSREYITVYKQRMRDGGHLEDIVADERIILKQFFKK
jgi:hypothetical protein